MIAECFIDTNILLYAVSSDPDERTKRDKARAVLSGKSVGLSTQVIGEFYENATRKLRPRLTHDQALSILEPLFTLPIQPITIEVVRHALEIKKRFQLRYWDACILAAANAMDARTVFSEDLSHEQEYDQVKVVNPFAD
jgi:predicted nucleic acid-binding protein